MKNYVKVFELFDKRTNVFKNVIVDKIDGQNKQPYTQTINYFFTFEEAKKKISSIWNFSTPELNKRIDKEISPSLVKKFGDKVKDKLGISKEKEIKIKNLSSLGISEKKESNQLFYYTYQGLRIAKIEFDRTKVHNRSWKLIFYYYDGVNGDSSKKVPGEIPSENKKKEDNIPGNIESNKQGEENIKPKELVYKKDIVVPFIDSSKKALDFIKKHLDDIYRPSDTEIEIGDMKVLKDSNKKFTIKTDNRSIEVKDPTILKGLNYVFNYEGPSDAKQIDNITNEEPKKNNKDKKVDKFVEYTNKKTEKDDFNIDNETNEYVIELIKLKKKIKEVINDDKIINKRKSITNKFRSIIAQDKATAYKLSDKVSKKIEETSKLINLIVSNDYTLKRNEVELIIKEKFLSEKSIKFFSSKFENIIDNIKLSESSFIEILNNEIVSIINNIKNEEKKEAN